MSIGTDLLDLDVTDTKELPTRLFAKELGVATVESQLEPVGNREFLKFIVGRMAPIYDIALRNTNKKLPDDHPFKGQIGTSVVKPEKCLESIEIDVLLGILARSTKTVAVGAQTGLHVPFVPFQNNEDQKIIQPANQLIIGRRGVGKSTLIVRGVELLKNSKTLCVVLDMQPYSNREDLAVLREIFSELTRMIGRALQQKSSEPFSIQGVEKLNHLAQAILSDPESFTSASAALRTILGDISHELNGDCFVFLDDAHLIDRQLQPELFHRIYGSLKGAGGWLKVAALTSLLHAYDARKRLGLQTPGDAQVISLDLTLVHPETAEKHLRAILESFLRLVGLESISQVIEEKALRRLVWANAGVPRDFLQMFARSIEHARKMRRSKVVLTDTNLAIGESGQQKMADLEDDAQNEQNQLKAALEKLQAYCFEKKHINAFLIRQESSPEYRVMETLRDLRLLHILHQTITPHKAGERYEAYMLDYSLFTGFRRRPTVKEMLPGDGKQFKASELRKLPILPKGFLAQRVPDSHS